MDPLPSHPQTRSLFIFGSHCLIPDRPNSIRSEFKSKSKTTPAPLVSDNFFLAQLQDGPFEKPPPVPRQV